MAKEDKSIKGIVRIAETNLDGNLPVWRAIRKIRGISFSFSHAIAQVCDFSNKRVGELSDEEIERLENILYNPHKYGIPKWMFNRRRDFETGKDKHLIASQLTFIQNMDIERLKRIRCWKGIRHSLGLPVRGQKTRTRRKSGITVGVQRSKK